jgi:rod shape determining protein RodA
MRGVIRPLVVVLGVAAVVSVLYIYSSTQADYGGSFALKQTVWIAIGVAAMVTLSRVRLKTVSALAYLIYGASIILLVAVLLIGTGPHGTRRWFDLGFLRFQPSEFAKIATILALARYLSGTRTMGDSLERVVKAVAITALPALLVLYEPDLGSAAVIGFLAFPTLFASGMSPLFLVFVLSPIFAFTLTSGVAIPSRLAGWGAFLVYLFGINYVGRFRTSTVVVIVIISLGAGAAAHKLWMGLEPYQRQRVEALFRQEELRHGAAFHAIQSRIAIGSGRVTGKGLFDGTQKALGLVPAQHTDFIFSVIGEEAGFIGSLFVLVLLLYICLKVFGVAGTVRNRFFYYVCFGLGSIILIQIFINVGMNLGITPVTGLPLPFISYGGSSTVVLWGGIGLVMSAYGARREY